MTAIADRLDLRLSVEDKNRLRRAAELHGCWWPPLSARLPCARLTRPSPIRRGYGTAAWQPMCEAARPRAWGWTRS